MSKDTLMLTPLKKALESLKKAVIQPKTEFTRDAAIQRFEYTYELCWKTLKRYFKLEAGLEEFNIKNIFREAGKANLITNVEAWFSYHEARNLTSHTYNQETAEKTFSVIQLFVPDAEKLLAKLEKIHASST